MVMHGCDVHTYVMILLSKCILGMVVFELSVAVYCRLEWGESTMHACSK